MSGANSVIDELDAAAQQLQDSIVQAGADLARTTSEEARKAAEVLDIESAISEAQGRLKDISEEVQSTADFLKNLPDQELVLYDIESPLSLTYNAKAGTSFFHVGMPNGASISQSDLESALTTGSAAPNTDFAKMVEQTGMVDAEKADEWEAFWQRSFEGGHNTYVSSKRFSDYVSLETLANEIILAVLSGGVTLGASAQEFERQMILEWVDVLSWAESVGSDNPEALATAVLEQVTELVLNADKTNDTNLAEIAFEDVEYTYVVEPKGAEEFSSMFRILGIDPKLIPTRVEAGIPHAAFVISVDTNSNVDIAETVETFMSFLASGPTSEIKMSHDTLEALNIPSGNELIADLSVDTAIRTSLKTIFAGDIERLQTYHRGGLVFDLTSSEFSDRLRRMFSGLALGNRGGLEVESFVVNGRKMSLELSARLNHKHSLGTLGSIAEQILDLGQKVVEEAARRVADLNNARARLTSERDNLRDQIASQNEELARLNSELNSLLNRMREACSVEIPHLGRISHPACGNL